MRSIALILCCFALAYTSEVTSAVDEVTTSESVAEKPVEVASVSESVPYHPRQLEARLSIEVAHEEEFADDDVDAAAEEKFEQVDLKNDPEEEEKEEGEAESVSESTKPEEEKKENDDGPKTEKVKEPAGAEESVKKEDQ